MDSSKEPRKPAEIDVAALHMARTRDGSDDATARKRWAGRIRIWAHRYGDDGRVNRYGKAGRRTVYDLVELEALADQLGIGVADV